MIKFNENTNASEIWNVTGSFGRLNGAVKIEENSYLAQYEGVEVFSEKETHKNGVVRQTGYIKNTTNKEIELNSFASKFIFDGGEYDVYTQSNFWQNESRGGWNELVSQVSIEGKSIRNCAEAAPFMAVWNKQTNRGFAFHIITYSTWQMKFARIKGERPETVNVAEFGVHPESLKFVLKPGEKISIPEIIYYEIRNKTDMDAYKLHDYLNELYPRREIPVIYNTWLYKFDRINYENVFAQMKRAKELGVEYFVIDAGWFGEGSNWSSCRGDYEENLTFGFCGRMKEIAEATREYGMKFGFWLEIECASDTANIVKNHPEYFIKAPDWSHFLNFSREDAREYIFNKIVYFVERFGAEFIKFDFNADLTFDPTNKAFYDYFKGYLKLIKDIKERYPNLYLENCASGGMRMGVRDGMKFDSFWLSDNQGPNEGMRIFKDSILRMPPQWIECWAVVKSVENFAPIYASDEYSEKLIACNDATISNVVGVNMSYLKALLTGSPIGFSCDLNQLSDNTFSELKGFIADFKKERDFWINANCRILTDTETMLVLQYSNPELSKIKIVVTSEKSIQNNIRVYPVVKKDAKYVVDEMERSGEELFENGIDIQIDSRYAGHCKAIEIKN